MKTITTVIRGIATDVLVIETVQTDAVGTLFYRAEILVLHRKTGAQKLVRRTRIPNTARILARELHLRGLRALEAFSTVE